MERNSIDGIAETASERNGSVATGGAARALSGAAVKRPAITDALAQTFFEEWARVGYAGLSMEAVAKKAGVGKAALYRRWRSKADMASDLISQTSARVATLIEPGDRGSLEADLYAMFLAGRRLMRHRLVRRILADLYAEIARRPELAAALKPGEEARSRKTQALVDRAIARGELGADVDRRAARDLLIAPLYWRLVALGGRLDRRELRGLARMTAAAMIAG